MSYFVHQINQLETRKYKTTINQTIPKPKTQIPTLKEKSIHQNHKQSTKVNQTAIVG